MHPENSTSVDGGETQRKTSAATAALLAEKICQFAMSASRSNLANPFGGSANPFGSGGTLCSCSLVAQYADHTHRRGIVQRKNFWLIQLKYAQSFGLIRSWKKIKISHKNSSRLAEPLRALAACSVCLRIEHACGPGGRHLRATGNVLQAQQRPPWEQSVN